MKCIAILVFWGALISLTGCRPPPKNACQGAIVSWPFLEFNEDDDVSSELGFQTDIEIRTSLGQGADAFLSVAVNDASEPTEESLVDNGLQSEVDEQGFVTFENVTFPAGASIIEFESEVFCGVIRTSREAYLTTDSNTLRCSLSVQGEEQVFGEKFRRLSDNADQTPASNELDANFIVVSGLKNTLVNISILNEESGVEEVAEGNSGELLENQVASVLQSGFYKMRAVCRNGELIEASPTIRYRVL